MRFSALLLIMVSAGTVFAQQDTGTATPTATNPIANPIITLASGFLENNFVNFFAYGDGVYDTYAPIEQNNQTVNNGSLGFEVGGGVNANHVFRNGNFSLSYQGGYRDYQSQIYGSGTSQNLSFAFNKRFTRRWTFSWTTGAGIYLYGGNFVSPDINAATAVVVNPFSPETKFFSTGITLAYQQTRHLSYVFSGNLFLQRYNYAGGIGSTGGTGSAGIQYRLAPRTTLSGNYAHSYFKYQRNVGQVSVDGVSLTLTHVFADHWVGSINGGVNRSNASGVIDVPVTLLIGNEAVGGYVIGNYRQVTYIPSFSASVSHTLRRYVLSISGGQGVAPSGNGYYLASRNDYLNGVISRNWRRSNIGVSGGYFRLTSVANAVNSSYISTSLSASYGLNVIHYVGIFFRYDYNHYGALRPFNGISDNRLSFGVNFSSKSIPMTLF